MRKLLCLFACFVTCLFGFSLEANKDTALALCHPTAKKIALSRNSSYESELCGCFSKSPRSINIRRSCPTPDIKENIEDFDIFESGACDHVCSLRQSGHPTPDLSK